MSKQRSFTAYVFSSDEELQTFIRTAIEPEGGTVSINPPMDPDSDHRCNADLILVDIDSHAHGNLDTIQKRTQTCHDTGIVVLGRSTPESAKRTSEALLKGIFDVVVLPDSLDDENSGVQFKRQMKRILSLWRTTVNLNAIQKLTSTTSRNPEATVQQRKIDLIVIASSTGGPSVLRQILMDLTPRPGVPVLCVQHIPEEFSQSLAEGLNNSTPWRVVEAKAHMPVEPNVFYLAPGGRHMVVRPNHDDTFPYQIQLNNLPPVNHCRPSADVLFESVLETVSGTVLAVVLTGMGDDGCRGVAALKQNGAICMTQSQQDCVVYGMPRAVVQSGNSDIDFSSTEMGAAIESMMGLPGDSAKKALAQE